MARGNQDLFVKKNSKLESFLKRTITEESYERIRAYESCIVVDDKDKKSFKFVILGDDCLFLTENPPKSIQEAVQLKDVISVELVKDYPEFLSGSERENTQHLAIKYLASDITKRKLFRRTRKSSHGALSTDQSFDRSNLSTPVSLVSSLDGSVDDNGYVTNSSLSNPFNNGSRPNSRGSVVSSRDSKNSKNKKKNESWDQDSILQSLKEEIEEQAEDLDFERLSTVRSVISNNRHYDHDSVCTSQTSSRQLPPPPKKTAFVHTAPDTDGLANDPVDTSCCFIKLLNKFRKNKVQHGNPEKSRTADYRTASSNEKPNSVNEKKLPHIALENEPIISSSPIPSFQVVESRRSSDISNGFGSRFGTPVDRERHRSGSVLGSEFSGSITGLHLLSVDGSSINDKRQTVLHIYLLNLVSPTLMLVRSAWSNYLLRATLQIETADDTKPKSAVVRASQHLREQTDLLFNQLKRELLNPRNNIDDNYRLLNEIKVASEKNFVIKKLFWRNSDLFLFLVRTLQKYLPKSAVNINSIDGRRQRVDEFEIVILMAEILTGMFRETEIIPDRLLILKAQRGKSVLDMLMTLTCLPEIPDKSSKSSNIKPSDQEFVELLDEYTRVSVAAVFELFLMARQASWAYTEDNFFNIGWMVRILEDYRTTEKFVERVIKQVLDVIGPSQYEMLSPEESICLYQHLTVLLTFLEYSPRVTAFIYNTYREEFKYYIRHQQVAKKLPANFPITQMTLNVAESVINKVRNAGNLSKNSPRL